MNFARGFSNHSSLASIAAAVLALLCSGTTISGYALEHQSLGGHVPGVISSLQPLERLPAQQQLKIAIDLPLRNAFGLDRLLSQLYDPASPGYHQWLTPAEFTKAFGPAETDYQAVITWAKANNLTVAGTHPNRLILDLEGSVATIERALHVQMMVYRHPTDARTFFAPDREPSPELAVRVLHISGLDNYSLARPRVQERPLSTEQPPLPNSGGGPGGTYIAADFRAAYVPGTTLTGAGQAVGLLQFDGYSTSDILYYIATNHLPSVTLSNVLIDGASGQPSGSGGEVEVCLDIESVLAMAPAISTIYVYEAPNSGGSSLWHDLLNRMANDNLARQLSCSWYTPGGSADPVADQIFQQMATQGQSFFNASGDDDAYCGLIDFPGDTPYITQVGGTTLSTAGPAGAYVSETVWNWGGGTGSGGGVSTQYPIPVWQQGLDMTANHGSTTMRNTPDVALTADHVYVRADAADKNVGGTSAAAPLWAGFTALVNQQAASNGRTAVGFINPAVYALGKSGSYGADFHDISTGNNTNSSCGPTMFPAVTGYDLATGWGSPPGTPLIDALAGPPDPLQISPNAGFTSTGGPGGPFDITSATFTVTNTGVTTLNWSLSNTSSWLNISVSSGTLTAGAAATVVFSLSAQAAALGPGTYTDTAWFTNINTAVGQSRMFLLTVLGAPEIDTQPVSQTVRVGGTANFALEAIGAPPLSYLWLRDGTPISGATTSAYATNNVQLADSGAQFSCVVTNAYGALTSQVAVLTVSANLVLNGGFETGDFTSWGAGMPSGSVSGTSTYVHSGSYGAKLGPSGSLGFLTQTLSTDAGSNYLISLWLVNPSSGTPNEVQVSWNGTVIYDALNLGSLPWTNLQFLVAASGPSTVLKIGVRNDPSYFGLDDISVTPTTNGLGAPLITLQPASQTVSPGSTATFFVAAMGTPSLSYFWLRDGAPIAGATTTAYTVNNLQLSDSGTGFSCLVSNTSGTITSQVAVLTVSTDLVQNGGFETGDFSSWGGGMSSASVTATTTYVHSGNYGARLGPVSALGYLSQTVSTDAGSNYLLSVWLRNPASGTPNEFQISWDGNVIYDGLNLGALPWTNLQFLVTASSSSTLLQIGVRNDPNYFGLDDISVTALSGGLTRPVILAQPAGQTVSPGSSAIFTVSAIGASPLSYSWRRNGAPIGGATTTSYTLNNAQLVDNGAQFSCVVTNTYGAVTSQVAVLTISTDLIQNGGFETGDFSFWGSGMTDGDVTTTSDYVHSGSYGAELGPVGGLEYLLQTIATSPGANYVLSLWLNNLDGGTPNEFQVSWDGLVIYDGIDLDVLPWTNLQFVVTASGSSTVLQIGAQNDPSWFGLDDISLTPIAPISIVTPIVTSGTLAFSWNSIVGWNYQVQYRTNLTQGIWLNLGSSVTATSSSTSASDSVGPDKQRFYRVVHLP